MSIDEHPPLEPADADRSDAIVVTWSPAGRADRRLVFEPRSGEGPAWERYEQARSSSGTFRTVGRELVESVAVETPDD